MIDLYLHDLHSDEKLWRNFSNYLAQKNIQPSAIPWYVRRAQFFLSKAENTRLSELTVDRVIKYLSFIVQETVMDDWQVNQSVDAVHFLLRDLFHLPWAEDIDWSSFKKDVPSLSPDHATLVRELDIPELIEQRVQQFDQALQDAYAELLTKLIRILRVRHYAARTEDTYLMWIGRFLRFHENAEIADINEQSIRQFLEYLAIERKVPPNTQKLALNSLAFLLLVASKNYGL